MIARRVALSLRGERQIATGIMAHDQSLGVAHEFEAVHASTIDPCLLLTEAVHEIARGFVRGNVAGDVEWGAGQVRRELSALRLRQRRVIVSSEPGTRLWQRMIVWLLSLLPIEWLL